MRGGVAQRYPQYDDPDQQEAARFLLSDFTSEKGHNASDEEHLHAGPMIRGITDEARLYTWIDVAKEHSDRVAKADRDALRHRLRELSVDEDAEFTRASEMETESEPAVADGGAVVEEADVDDDTSPLDDDQVWQEYADEAAFESAKDDQWRVVQDLVTTVEEVEDALDREFAKDVVPRHTVELLEERASELRGETDE